VALRGGFDALIGEAFQRMQDKTGGADTEERIMMLIHQNFTRALNMTASELLSHPTMRGRQTEPAVIEACIRDYWTQGWKEKLDTLDRSVLFSRALCRERGVTAD
jgi:hypothetical protein